MTALGDEIAGSAHDLARSLWAELGVSGAPRRHDWQALDLEPLVIFTACCASDDARFRARTIRWCAKNSRFLSSYRLHHFCGKVHEATRSSAERFVEEVEAAARRERSAKRANVVPDLRRPALIQLRLRAVLGVSARAEVLKLLLSDPDQPRTASSMVRRAGYGKSGVAQALELLTAAGITTARPEGNRLVYRLARPAEVAQALDPMPAVFPDWAAAFNVVEGLLRYGKEAPPQPSRRTAAAAGLVRDLADDLRDVCAGVRPPPRIQGAQGVEAFEEWARTFAAAQAAGTGAGAQAPEVVYTVHRLLLGGWIATVREPGDQPRPLALSENPVLSERRAHRRPRPDDVMAAANVIESMLLDMRIRDVQRSQGSLVSREAVGHALLPAMSREFATELLQPMHKGQSASFTEEFLQQWFTNRRRRYTQTA